MIDYGEPGPGGPEDRARWLTDAARSVQTPGSVLQWYGIASALLAVILLMVLLVSPDTFARPYFDRMVEAQKDQPAGQRQPIPPYKKFVQTFQIAGVVVYLIAMVSGVLAAIGGAKMKQLTGYGWAMSGAILAVIPCTSSCCCAGIFVGLWALVVLFGSDVRLAFKRVGAAGGIDAVIESPDAIGPI